MRISLIAKILEAEGLALSTAYYHLSDNRQAYDNRAKKIRQLQRQAIQQKVRNLIDEGMNTEMIANDWNIPLATLNKIYVKF